MMFASFLVLLALLSLLLPSCSFCPRVSLHAGPLSQQRLCVQMAINADKSADDLIKLADALHLKGDNKVRFVAMMIATQKNHELAQAQAQAGKDHELAQAQAAKDHELAQAGKDHKFELELAQSYRHSQLSAISKRYVCSGSMFAFPKSR